MLSGIEGLESLTLTTNGVRLQELAPQLHDAGVQRVNVSLDTLRPERFKEITGRNLLSHVLSGIERAEEVGLRPVKINNVVMRGINDDEIEDFARLTLKKSYQVRFIELMPTNGCGFLENSPSNPLSTPPVRQGSAHYQELLVEWDLSPP
jgi:cyclic pyranopterin phosphate synthase